MATIVLAAAGATIGSGFGGAVFGLSGAVIGRAVGATLGRVIDQRLLGAGSQAVETGRVDRFRLTGAGEGAAIARVWGRMRLGGQVIWASRFVEDRTVSRGGKGTPRPASVDYSYSVSLAIALCEGEITGIGRIWADGVEIGREELAFRVYRGTEDQLPDPRIEAVEGAGRVPAYRGIAYVVIEDLGLGRFGNRVPQFSFEVVRRADAGDVPDLTSGVRAVALMPGTGEYALATTPVHYAKGPGENVSANVNSPSGRADVETSFSALREELPNVGSVALIVSWFGDDLRCGDCALRPKVEYATQDGVGMPWEVCGLPRAQAVEIARVEDRPIYGGTPADASVIEAIAAIRAGGQAVLFYPFILMEQLAGNSLPDPYSGGAGQAVLPWRGRITSSLAPGVAGSGRGCGVFWQCAGGGFCAGWRAGSLFRPGGVELSEVHPALCLAVQSRGRGRGVLRGLGDAGADADPRRGRCVSGGGGIAGAGGRGARDPGACVQDILCRRLVGVFRVSFARGEPVFSP